jgi:hypothetical protein
MAISQADLWPAQLPVCPSSARNRGFGPSIPGQIQRDISGAILRLPRSYPVYRVVSSRLDRASIQTSVSGCRCRQKWTTGCLTSAAFAASSRLHAGSCFGLRARCLNCHSVGEPFLCCEQDQQGSHWPVGHF